MSFRSIGEGTGKLMTSECNVRQLGLSSHESIRCQRQAQLLTAFIELVSDPFMESGQSASKSGSSCITARKILCSDSQSAMK